MLLEQSREEELSLVIQSVVFTSPLTNTSGDHSALGDSNVRVLNGVAEVRINRLLVGPHIEMLRYKMCYALRHSRSPAHALKILVPALETSWKNYVYLVNSRT